MESNNLVNEDLMKVTTGRFMLSLALLFVLVILLSFYHCDHLVLERESGSMCFSCICLFILHALRFVLLLFLLLSWVNKRKCFQNKVFSSPN